MEEAIKSYNVFRKYVLVVASDGDEVKSQQGAKEKAVEICIDQLQPNELFKMYGDKSKETKYYNGKITNGGMDYKEKMLDIGGESAYLDCIDDSEPQLIEGKILLWIFIISVTIIKFAALVMIG